MKRGQHRPPSVLGGRRGAAIITAGVFAAISLICSQEVSAGSCDDVEYATASFASASPVGVSQSAEPAAGVARADVGADAIAVLSTSMVPGGLQGGPTGWSTVRTAVSTTDLSGPGYGVGSRAAN